jgi:hypothetical protein
VVLKFQPGFTWLIFFVLKKVIAKIEAVGVQNFEPLPDIYIQFNFELYLLKIK